MNFLLLLFIGSYLKVTNCKTNILVMFETELDKVQKLTLFHFHSNNKVLFEHGHQESCQLNLALIWACMFSQHLILNLGYLLPSTSHCFHNQFEIICVFTDSWLNHFILEYSLTNITKAFVKYVNQTLWHHVDYRCWCWCWCYFDVLEHLMSSSKPLIKHTTWLSREFCSM